MKWSRECIFGCNRSLKDFRIEDPDFRYFVIPAAKPPKYFQWMTTAELESNFGKQAVGDFLRSISSGLQAFPAIESLYVLKEKYLTTAMFEEERIVATRENGHGITEYLVKWKQIPPTVLSWEVTVPRELLSHYMDALDRRNPIKHPDFSKIQNISNFRPIESKSYKGNILDQDNLAIVNRMIKNWHEKERNWIWDPEYHRYEILAAVFTEIAEITSTNGPFLLILPKDQAKRCQDVFEAWTDFRVTEITNYFTKCEFQSFIVNDGIMSDVFIFTSLNTSIINVAMKIQWLYVVFDSDLWGLFRPIMKAELSLSVPMDQLTIVCQRLSKIRQIDYMDMIFGKDYVLKDKDEFVQSRLIQTKRTKGIPRDMILYIPISELQRQLIINLLYRVIPTHCQYEECSDPLLLIADHPLLFQRNIKYDEVPLEDIVQTSGKLYFIDQYLESVKGGKILIMCKRPGMIDLVAELCRRREYAFLRLDGREGSYEKENARIFLSHIHQRAVDAIRPDAIIVCNNTEHDFQTKAQVYRLTVKYLSEREKPVEDRYRRVLQYVYDIGAACIEKNNTFFTYDLTAILNYNFPEHVDCYNAGFKYSNFPSRWLRSLGQDHAKVTDLSLEKIDLVMGLLPFHGLLRTAELLAKDLKLLSAIDARMTCFHIFSCMIRSIFSKETAEMLINRIASIIMITTMSGQCMWTHVEAPYIQEKMKTKVYSENNILEAIEKDKKYMLLLSMADKRGWGFGHSFPCSLHWTELHDYCLMYALYNDNMTITRQVDIEERVIKVLKEFDIQRATTICAYNVEDIMQRRIVISQEIARSNRIVVAENILSPKEWAEAYDPDPETLASSKMLQKKIIYSLYVGNITGYTIDNIVDGIYAMGCIILTPRSVTKAIVFAVLEKCYSLNPELERVILSEPELHADISSIPHATLERLTDRLWEYQQINNAKPTYPENVMMYEQTTTKDNISARIATLFMLQTGGLLKLISTKGIVETLADCNIRLYDYSEIEKHRHVVRKYAFIALHMNNVMKSTAIVKALPRNVDHSLVIVQLGSWKQGIPVGYFVKRFIRDSNHDLHRFDCIISDKDGPVNYLIIEYLTTKKVRKCYKEGSIHGAYTALTEAHSEKGIKLISEHDISDGFAFFGLRNPFIRHLLRKCVT